MNEFLMILPMSSYFFCAFTLSMEWSILIWYIIDIYKVETILYETVDQLSCLSSPIWKLLKFYNFE